MLRAACRRLCGDLCRHRGGDFRVADPLRSGADDAALRRRFSAGRPGGAGGLLRAASSRGRGAASGIRRRAGWLPPRAARGVGALGGVLPTLSDLGDGCGNGL